MAVEPRTPTSKASRDHLPPQVLRQVEEGERLQRELLGQPEPAAANGNGHTEPGQSQPQPSPPPPPQPEPTQPPIAAGGDPAEDDWRQRFEREHGRLEKAREDMRAMSDRMAQLEQLIVTQQALGPKQPAEPQRFEPELTQEERNDWGEAITIVNKLLEPRVKELDSKLKMLDERLQGLGQAHVQDARSRMLQILDTNPSFGLGADQNCWRILNDDPEFVDMWLKRVDRYSGRLRHDMLKEAYASNDATRMAAFFEDFLKESGRLAQPITRPPANGAQPPQGYDPAQVEGVLPGMERWASPGRPRAAPVAPTTPAGPEWYTTGDIDRFFKDKTAGRWKGRETEADQYERGLFAAMNQGRVRQGPPQP